MHMELALLAEPVWFHYSKQELTLFSYWVGETDTVSLTQQARGLWLILKGWEIELVRIGVSNLNT
jgi:hypothetical protein